MMTLDQKIVCSETVFAQIIDDEMVLLDMQTENYFGMDNVGATMWHMIEKHSTLREVLMELLTYYDVEEEVLKNDLFAFVAKLQNSGLVHLENE